MPFNLSSVLVETYKFLWRERADLWAYALLPVVIVAATKTATLWFFGEWETFFEPLPPPEEASPETGSPLPGITLGAAGVINIVVGFVTYVMFAVAWHRRYLIGNEGQTIGAALRWQAHHWHFAGRFVGMLVIVAVIGWVVSLPMVYFAGGGVTPSAIAFAFFVTFFVLGLVYGRLLLVLPAAAKGDKMGFREAADRTKGKSWLMFGIGLLPPFPVFGAMLLILTPITAALASAIGPSISLLLVILLAQQVFSFAAIAAGVTALSIAHRHLAGN